MARPGAVCGHASQKRVTKASYRSASIAARSPHQVFTTDAYSLERLAHIRQTLQISPNSFGQRPFALERQGPLGGLYAENTRWTYGDVVFVGLNVPGSNNNYVHAGECVSTKSARTQVECDADNAEYRARDAANIAFLAGL